jgi:D-serine deaminase-like pyridoxal phosphate-dependent protein
VGLERPQISQISQINTPALVIDLDAVDANIAATLQILGGDANLWRPHLKTAKLLLTMGRIREAGVLQAKCATTLELETACQAGFEDVLLAYPVVGPAVDAVNAIAKGFPKVCISALVESTDMVEQWRGTGVGLFIDLNSGMDRTGMALEPGDAVAAVARSILAAGLRFGGLHFYDGHASGFPAASARELVHAGYERLLRVARCVEAAGITVAEVVTAGTPAFHHAAGCQVLRKAGLLHRLSPGTVLYNDRRSLTQLPADAGYRAAAWVVSRVVSHPGGNRFCCDAGHKTVSADAGDPTCEVEGHPEWTPRHPSEEHLPVDVPAGSTLPERGTLLWLCPSHVCPTVNNFDHAVVLERGAIRGVERVTARGRHSPAHATS